MTNNDVVDRNKILGSATQDFGFDKVLRGYDIKQVNEYISNLLATNKNAGELFDQRFEELKNSKSMLEYELSQSKGEVEKLTKLLEEIRAQRDTLQAQETSKGSSLDTFGHHRYCVRYSMAVIVSPKVVPKILHAPSFK